jgi:hypothetical protein
VLRLVGLGVVAVRSPVALQRPCSAHFCIRGAVREVREDVGVGAAVLVDRRREWADSRRLAC